MDGWGTTAVGSVGGEAAVASSRAVATRAPATGGMARREDEGVGSNGS